MTKLELTTAIVELAGLNSKKEDAIKRMVSATKDVCQRRYDKVMDESNREQAAKYVVMCCTGIVASGIDKNCTPIH